MFNGNEEVAGEPSQGVRASISDFTKKIFDSIFDYRGTPQWEDVPDELLGAEPYCRICQVISDVNGESRSTGTGWYWRNGVVLTAAHVVYRATGARVRFANSDAWIAASAIRIPSRYPGLESTGLKGSQYDLAQLYIHPDQALRLSDSFRFDGDPSMFRVIGFLGSRLKTHAASGRVGADFIAHNAHTESGQSGCPVFTNNTFCGIHLGAFGISRPYMGAPERTFTGFLNSAVKPTDRAIHEYQ